MQGDTGIQGIPGVSGEQVPHAYYKLHFIVASNVSYHLKNTALFFFSKGAKGVKGPKGPVSCDKLREMLLGLFLLK